MFNRKKITKRIAVFSMLAFLVCAIQVPTVHATKDVVLTDLAVVAQEEWRTDTGYEYPLTPADSDWASLSYLEQLNACDMPIEMLSGCSTEELADLVLNYPLLGDIFAFDNIDLAIEHLINTSNICEEFFSRDDITDLLIKKYDGMHVDYEELLNVSNVTAIADSGYVGELFLQTYFAYVIHSLTDTQIQEVSKIIGEKYEAKKGICDDFATSLLIYDWLQIENGAIPQNLVPESIEPDLVSNKNILVISETTTGLYEINATSGFTSSGSTVQLSNGGTYTVGTYTLYGKTTGCYKYYSGDYTTSEATTLSNYFDNLHPSWNRLSYCTRKYNCHSYTWIKSSGSNTYWLNNPDDFSGSAAFTLVGYNYNNISLSSGDKIVINSATSFDDGFGNKTYSVHSANVISSSGSTRSKLGAYGVYVIPVDELFTFYSGFFYSVYR